MWILGAISRCNAWPTGGEKREADAVLMTVNHREVPGSAGSGGLPTAAPADPSYEGLGPLRLAPGDHNGRCGLAFACHQGNWRVAYA
jgi:hypothetical protein